jgi:hypothetical protein
MQLRQAANSSILAPGFQAVTDIKFWCERTMPWISRGTMFLCEQVQMVGAPIAAQLSCWIFSIGLYLQICLLALRSSLPKDAQLFPR